MTLFAITLSVEPTTDVNTGLLNSGYLTNNVLLIVLIRDGWALVNIGFLIELISKLMWSVSN